MGFLTRLFVIGFGFTFFLLFSQGAWSQDFSVLDRDLLQLEDLINDTIISSQEQLKLLEDLKTSLNESGNLIASYESIITEQEILLKDLQNRLNEMSETYRMQQNLSSKYAQNSKFWRTFMLIAVPAAAVISGSVVWAAGR